MQIEPGATLRQREGGAVHHEGYREAVRGAAFQQPGGSGNKADDKKSGCGSVLGASSAALIALGAAAAVLFKKKGE